jgi:hypothetical protein
MTTLNNELPINNDDYENNVVCSEFYDNLRRQEHVIFDIVIVGWYKNIVDSSPYIDMSVQFYQSHHLI